MTKKASMKNLKKMKPKLKARTRSGEKEMAPLADQGDSYFHETLIPENNLTPQQHSNKKKTTFLRGKMKPPSMPHALNNSTNSNNVIMENIERLEATQDSTDEESIMGMSTEKELVEGDSVGNDVIEDLSGEGVAEEKEGGGEKGEKYYEDEEKEEKEENAPHDNIKSYTIKSNTPEGKSHHPWNKVLFKDAVEEDEESDEDYYKQDYFMLGLSESRTNIHEDSGDPEVSSLSHQILNEANTTKRVELEIHEKEEGEMERSAEEAEQYKKNNYMSTDDRRNFQDVEIRRQAYNVFNDALVMSMGQKNEGDSITGSTGVRRGSSATQNFSNDAANPHPNSTQGNGVSAPTPKDNRPPVPTSSIPKANSTQSDGNDFATILKHATAPSSSPMAPAPNSGNSTGSDFATALRKAASNGSGKSEASSPSQQPQQEDFASALKQKATRGSTRGGALDASNKSSSDDLRQQEQLDFASALKRRAGRSLTPESENDKASDNGNEEEEDKSENNPFASALKQKRDRLRHQSEPITSSVDENTVTSSSAEKAEQPRRAKSEMEVGHKMAAENVQSTHAKLKGVDELTHPAKSDVARDSKAYAMPDEAADPKVYVKSIGAADPKTPAKSHSLVGSSLLPKSKTSEKPKSPPDLDRGGVTSIREALVNDGPMSPGDSLPPAYPPSSTNISPSKYSEDITKLAKENHKLRKRRKELLTLLSQTAQQFSAYEKVCAEKICRLEEKNTALEMKSSYRRKRAEVQFATSIAEDLDKHKKGDASNGMTTPQSGKMYDGEVVRRLSSGVLMQERQIKSKDELIAQLKLRCEVLKQSLMDKDGEHIQEKNLWEEERTKMAQKLDSSSPSRQSHGELLSKKMECTRLRKELETSLGDITMLTSALETNNEALDAAVLELDKLKAWKAEYGEVAASVVDPPDLSSTTDAEKLRAELKGKDDETAQLQRDLESSLNEIEELREAVNKAAAAKGYDDFQNNIEDLKREASASKKDAEIAKERIAQLEAELKSNAGAGSAKSLDPESSESHSQINGVSQNKSSTLVDDSSYSTAEARSVASGSPLPEAGAGRGRTMLGGLRRAFGAPRASPDTAAEEPADLETRLKQRDIKIKSFDAMIHSYLKIIDKLKGDIEKMDSEKEEAEYACAQKIEQLEEDNKAYEIQVLGYEKALSSLNEAQSKTWKPSQDNEDIVDDNMFMWDEAEEFDEAEGKDDTDFRAEYLALQRTITELESSRSVQEDQIETLKAELVKLRVKSQREKELALANLAEENEIIKAQRSALEDQLVEINKSAGVLRDISSADASGENHKTSGSDPALVSQVVMLEKANKVLESSVDSLRADKETLLTPLLEKIALLEEEKRMAEEEMNTKLEVREHTIRNLENSLQQLQKGAGKSFRIAKGKSKRFPRSKPTSGK